MKCCFCGAWTDVLSTINGRRRRRCANDHRFTTTEVVVSHSRKQTSDRDRQIAAAVVDHGKSAEEVAKSFGISQRRVSAVVREQRPEFNAKSEANRRRWAKREA